MKTTQTQIIVRALNLRARHGFVQIGQRRFPCLLGRNGQAFLKREGDGKSPKGRWKLEILYFRPDRKRHFNTSLKIKALRPDDGWCDAVGDKNYNRKVRLPFPASHEALWRQDSAYDLLVTTSHNQRPRMQGGGSAIFFHLIREGAAYTEGCIAVKERDMKHILTTCSRHTTLVI